MAIALVMIVLLGTLLTGCGGGHQKMTLTRQPTPAGAATSSTAVATTTPVAPAPPAQPGSKNRYTRYAYKAPGTYTVKWTLQSRTDYPGCEDPYGEVVPATATVTVAPG